MNTRSMLLAYATRYGSTQEVAEAICAALRKAGLKVELQPMQDKNFHVAGSALGEIQ